MKVDEYECLDGADAVLPERHDGLTIEMVAHWDTTRRVRVQRSGTTMFACSVRPQPPLWFITECLPQRRGPEPASMLLAVCEWLAAERGATEIIAIHPAFWEEQLVAAGASVLHRMVPMWAPLDGDLLLMHTRPLPVSAETTSLDMSVDGPAVLGQLSAEADRDSDIRVWQDIVAGRYGPVIHDATMKLVQDTALRAAIAVTEYIGAPLIAHCVAAAAERGKGLGRGLLIECLKGLYEAGYTDCQLNVSEENRIARRLYRSVGFLQNRPTLRVSRLGRKQTGHA